MKKLNKVLEEIVEPKTDMVLYDPKHRPIDVNIPCNKYDPDDKPKYLVSYDPVKDGGDGSISFKVENGVVENLQYKHGQFSVDKILDTLRECHSKWWKSI